MAILARAEIFDPSEIVAVHLIGKTVRSCYLMGVDKRSGKNFDHRKRWLEEKLKLLAANFGIDLLAFSCMSNHFHLLLRSRPDVVATWDDTQVALRWWQLCPTWMRLLCQYIAMRANGEDGKGLGRFWQGRYKAVRILDEESLLACAAYIDLNPIRADMAETLEQSDYTSVQRRVQAIKATALDTDSSGDLPPVIERAASESATPPRPDAFLAPVSIDERKDPLGPHASRNGRRSSD